MRTPTKACFRDVRAETSGIGVQYISCLESPRNRSLDPSPSCSARPPLPKTEKKRHVIPFKVDDKELRNLDRKAKDLGVSRSELIRLAIKRLLGKG